MLKNLIILEGNESVQCDTVHDVIKVLIDDNYYNLSEQEKNDKIKMLAIGNCIGTDREIIEDFKIMLNKNVDSKFIIKDETTYLLSLLMMNKIILLEKTDANILLKDIEKSDVDDNYIVVNKFAKDILLRYLKKA